MLQNRFPSYKVITCCHKIRCSLRGAFLLEECMQTTITEQIQIAESRLTRYYEAEKAILSGQPTR